MKNNSSEPKFRVSSGNVFVDLSVPRPRQELVKSDLVRAICSILSGKGLRQVDAAARLGISQPKVSLLMRGRTDGFSTDHLMRLLNRLGQSINIVVKPSHSSRAVASTRVQYAAPLMVPDKGSSYGTVRAAKKSVRVRATKKK